jgi:hypothetical protein
MEAMTTFTVFKCSFPNGESDPRDLSDSKKKVPANFFVLDANGLFLLE